MPKEIMIKKVKLLTVTGWAIAGSFVFIDAASADHVYNCNTFSHYPIPRPQPQTKRHPQPQHRPTVDDSYTLRPVINYQNFYKNPDLNPPIVEPPATLMDTQSMMDMNSERVFIVLIVLILWVIWGPIFSPKKDSR